MPEERQHTSSDRLCSIVEQKRCCHSVGACFRPYTVLASISLSIFGQDLNYSISHECVKKSSAYATGKTWPCSRRQKQYSECHQCRCACKQSVSIHVFLKATACSTSAFDIACGFQRLTHLQSSAESMSSCETLFQNLSCCSVHLLLHSFDDQLIRKFWISLEKLRLVEFDPRLFLLNVFVYSKQTLNDGLAVPWCHGSGKQLPSILTFAGWLRRAVK